MELYLWITQGKIYAESHLKDKTWQTLILAMQIFAAQILPMQFLLRAKVAAETKKSELSQQYFESYNHLKTLSPQEQIQYYLNQISVKNKEIEGQQRQISSLENMVGTALGRPQMQVDNFHSQGDVMSDKETANYNMNQAKFGGGFAAQGTQTGGNLGDNSTNNTESQQASLVLIICQKCGHRNPHHFKFCTKCGTELT